jgi:hypothetical protein
VVTNHTFTSKSLMKTKYAAVKSIMRRESRDS